VLILVPRPVALPLVNNLATDYACCAVNLATQWFHITASIFHILGLWSTLYKIWLVHATMWNIFTSRPAVAYDNAYSVLNYNKQKSTHPLHSILQHFWGYFQNLTYCPVTNRSKDLGICTWHYLVLSSKLIIKRYHTICCSTYQHIWPLESCNIHKLLCMKF
jgi:hypothetical protein